MNDPDKEASADAVNKEKAVGKPANKPVPGFPPVADVSVQVAYINIGEDVAIPVDLESGRIVSANAEGTLGIVIYGGDPGDREGETFRSEKAIKIPRLLQSDILLNFHVAEIGYHEGRQARHFRADIGVVGADSFYRFDKANTFTTIPGFPGEACYVGFYLSPISHYQLCLVSRNRVWPNRLNSYISARSISPKDLYETIESQRETTDTKTFSSLLFLPDPTEFQKGPLQNEPFIKVVSRESLNVAYAKKEVGGWWFNIPMASYPWMTANLERLLTGCIDEAENPLETGKGASLRSWNLGAWFQLLKHLVLGLNSLHRKGAIHGDPRPANVMTDVHRDELRPEGFRWIDIGLGYSSRGVIPEAGGTPIEEETSITPRPLGGGRTTPFYAPERVEAVEFEDADVVQLEETSEKGRSKLRFLWKNRTDLPPTVLQLKEAGTPVRELGKLQRGDRVQVREFLFEVERVEDESITVSHIYEVFLDRVLVERKGSERDIVIQRLGNAAISRYRIFQQWSQATDIYGLGIITLYLFFIRGLYLTKKAASAVKDSSETALLRNPVYDRSNRERIFADLAALLGNQSFLESLLQNLKINSFENPQSLWNQDVQLPESELGGQIKEVSEVIYATDSNFEFIWRGLNRNHGLFIQVVYFCLSCVWREEEVREIAQRTKFDFKPFCETRLVNGSQDLQESPSRMALKQLEDLIRLINNRAVLGSEIVSDSVNLRILGRSREEQMIALREDLSEANSRILEVQETQNRKLSELQAIFESVEFTLNKARKEIESHGKIFGGIDRSFIDNLVEGIRKRASEGKELSVESPSLKPTNPAIKDD